MAQNYQTISHGNVAKGMDTKASPDQIKPGYAELIQNMDTSTAGYLETRKGYTPFLGDLPIPGRKDSAYSTTNIQLDDVTPSIIGIWGTIAESTPFTVLWIEVDADGLVQKGQASATLITATDPGEIVLDAGVLATMTDGNLIWFYGINSSNFFGSDLPGFGIPNIDCLTNYSTESDSYLLATQNSRMFRELKFSEATQTQKDFYFDGWDTQNIFGSTGLGNSTYTTAVTDALVVPNIDRYYFWFQPNSAGNGGLESDNVVDGYAPISSIVVTDQAPNWQIDITFNFLNQAGNTLAEIMLDGGAKDAPYTSDSYASWVKLKDSPFRELEGISIPATSLGGDTIRATVAKADYDDIAPITITDTSTSGGFFDHVLIMTDPDHSIYVDDNNIPILRTTSLDFLTVLERESNDNLKVEIVTDGSKLQNGGFATLFLEYSNSFNVKDVVVLAGPPIIELFPHDQLNINDEFYTVVSIVDDRVTLDRPGALTITSAGGSGAGYRIIELVGRWIPIFSISDARDPTGLSPGVSGEAEITPTRAVGIGDSTFFTDGILNKLVKYDGVNFYTAGLPSFSVQGSPFTEHASQAISTEVAPIKGNVELIVREDITRATPFILRFDDKTLRPNVSIGDRIAVTKNFGGQTFLDKMQVVGFYNSLLSSAAYNGGSGYTDNDQFIAVLPDTFHCAGGFQLLDKDYSNCQVSIPSTYFYYYKYSFIDRNSNEIVSTISGFGTEVVLWSAGRIHHQIQMFPKFGDYDYDHIDVEVYRTLANPTGRPDAENYFRVARKSVYTTSDRTGVLTIIDEVPDILLDDSSREDDRSVALKGADFPISMEPPPKSKYIASINNRLILGNVTRPARAEVEAFYTGIQDIASQGTPDTDSNIEVPLRGKSLTVGIVDESGTRNYKCTFLQTSDWSEVSGLYNIESVDAAPENNAAVIQQLGARVPNGKEEYEMMVSKFIVSDVYTSVPTGENSFLTVDPSTETNRSRAFKFRTGDETANFHSLTIAMKRTSDEGLISPDIYCDIYLTNSASISPAGASNVARRSTAVVLDESLQSKYPQLYFEFDSTTAIQPNDYYWAVITWGGNIGTVTGLEFQTNSGPFDPGIFQSIGTVKSTSPSVPGTAAAGWAAMDFNTRGIFSVSSVANQATRITTLTAEQWCQNLTPRWSHRDDPNDTGEKFESLNINENLNSDYTPDNSSERGESGWWFPVNGTAPELTTLGYHNEADAGWTVEHFQGAWVEDEEESLTTWIYSAETPAADTYIIPIAVFPRKAGRTEWAAAGTSSSTKPQFPVVVENYNDALEWNVSPLSQGLRDIGKALSCVMVYDDCDAPDSPLRVPPFSVNFSNGKLIIEVQNPNAVVTVTNDMGEDIDLFINNQLVDDTDTYTLTERAYPSRVLISPENHPENFDNPWSQAQVSSDSLVDLNPGDGESITGITSFFGTSSGTSAAQLGNTLIVFKEHSIYSIDISPESRLDRSPVRQVQKIESSGQGCEFPDSIVAVDDGIFFANRSGIYKVRKNLDVTYEGALMEGYWNSSITKFNSLVAYEDKTRQQYKLAVAPIRDFISAPYQPEQTRLPMNDSVIVADYSRSPGDPANIRWTTYTNYGATAWKYFLGSNYFATYNNCIMQVREAGNNSDYLDIDQAIPAAVTFGPTSFGDSGTKAHIHRIVTHLDTDTPITDLVVSSATDMSTTFVTDQIISFTGVGLKLKSIPVSLVTDHVHWHQLKYEHSTIQEALKICSYDYKVRSTDELGIPQEDST